MNVWLEERLVRWNMIASTWLEVTCACVSQAMWEQKITVKVSFFVKFIVGSFPQSLLNEVT